MSSTTPRQGATSGALGAAGFDRTGSAAIAERSSRAISAGSASPESARFVARLGSPTRSRASALDASACDASLGQKK